MQARGRNKLHEQGSKTNEGKNAKTGGLRVCEREEEG